MYKLCYNIVNRPAAQDLCGCVSLDVLGLKTDADHSRGDRAQERQQVEEPEDPGQLDLL